MPRIFLHSTLVAAVVATAATAADAQDAVLSQFYGNGVHAYFDGNLAKARQELTTAINAGSKDPRAYYFRALTNLRYGLQDEARADFKHGAALETADSNHLYNVSKSLERVQGSERRTLEEYRSVARASAVARQEKRMQARYEALRRSEADKLRRVARPRIDRTQPAVAVERQPAAARAAAAAAQTPVEADPFATNAATAVPPAPKSGSAAGKAADADNPFGDSALEESESTGPAAPAAEAEDLFGTGAAAPAAPKEAAPQPPAEAEPGNPFNLGPAAEETPRKAEADAGAEPAMPDASNPFSDDAAPKSDAPPAPTTEDNPFGN